MIGRLLCRLGLHAWQRIISGWGVGPGPVICRRPGCTAADVEDT